MSLVGTRVSMTHRCAIERDANADTTDDWGNPQPPDWQAHLSDVPCRGWVSSGREPVDRDKTVVLVDRRLMVPLDTDVTERDRVAGVTERGATVFEGPMGIEAVLRRGTHLELALERIR